MQKLAAKLTEKLLRRRLISPEQSEWCAYLVECKLEQLLCFSVLITLGCLIAPLWKVLLLNWGVVFLRRKANGKQKEWEERYNAKRKAQVEAAKAAIRTEDMEKGIFIPVSQLPRQEPRKATLPASAAI